MQKFSKTLLGCAVFTVTQMMVLPQVWAAPCTIDTDAQVEANNIECTATRIEYSEGLRALYARGVNAHLKVPEAVTLNLSGASTTANNGVAHAAGGGKLTVVDTLNLKQSGEGNSYGALARDAGSKLIVGGDLFVDMMSNKGGGTRRAILALGGGSIEVLGRVSIKAAGEGFRSPRGLAAEGSGSSLFYKDALVDLREVDATGISGGENTWGVRANSPGGQVVGTGKTEVLVSGKGVGYRAGAGKNRVDGVLAASVENGSLESAAVHVYSSGTLQVGGASSFSNPKGRGLLLALDSSSSESAFTAGAELTIKALQGIVFQSSDVRVNRTSLQNANVEATQEIWTALGQVQADFNGSAGRYTGTSALEATAKLDIILTDGAVWNLQGNSAFTSLVLSLKATLSSGGASHTVTGELSNISGVLDLQGASFSAGDALTVAGNYNGGGTLLIDTVLGDGTSSPSTKGWRSWISPLP